MIKKFSSLRGWDLKKFPLNRVRFTLSTDKALWKHRRRKLAISEASQVCAGSQMYLSPCTVVPTALAQWLQCWVPNWLCQLVNCFQSFLLKAVMLSVLNTGGVCWFSRDWGKEINQEAHTVVSKGSSYLWYSGIHLLQRFISSVFFLFSSVSGDMQS